jgi:DNA gyrase subunit A
MVVADPEGSLLTVCENGYGKRTPFGPNTSDADVELPEGEDDLSGEESAEATPRQEPHESDTASAEPDAPEEELRSQMRYRRQRRGGKGVRDIRTSERNGAVVGIVAVRSGDEIMLITAQGMVNRTNVDEVRLVGRNTQGVRIMNLNEGDRIASVARIAREDVDETPRSESESESPEAGAAPSDPA